MLKAFILSELSFIIIVDIKDRLFYKSQEDNWLLQQTQI